MIMLGPTVSRWGWLPPRQPYRLNPKGLHAIRAHIPRSVPNILLDEIAPFGTTMNRYFAEVSEFC
jgi:hypothetical protein